MVCFAISLMGVIVPGAASAQPDSEHPFEVVPGSAALMSTTTQAGSHGDLTTKLDFAHEESSGNTFNDVRNIVAKLPAGFTGSNTSVPACPASDLLGEVVEAGSKCPPDTQVGTVSFDLTLEKKPVYVTFPVYNVEVTSSGVAAELGFNAIIFSQVLSVSARPEDLGLDVTVPNIEDVGEIHNTSFTVWGVPAAHEHDAERGRQCYPQPTTSTNVVCEGGGESAGIPAKPYLRMPTSCTGESLKVPLEAESWEEPGKVSVGVAEVPPVVECERVPFSPSIEIEPTTRSAESPSGLNVSLVVPQSWERPETIATSDLKDARVALPEGMTINPSSGSGLGACTPQQYASETASSLPGAGCPSESKIGSIEIETPILAEKLNGAIYVATPHDNPFNSLLSLYIVAKAPPRGIIVKVAGQVELNETTGQVVTTFDNNPQQPFSRFTLKFRPGATAPLVSPPSCGRYTSNASLTPWSVPASPRLLSSSFEVTRGVHEGPCPSGGVPPFAPHVLSGVESNDAGSYSPFYLRLIREDGEQEITKFTTVLPPGLTGNLSGIPFCPEAAIEAARIASGRQELTASSCPATSEVGHTIVGAGVGTVLAQALGKVYLAGPYHGAPLSLVSITSATVGPFDLGTVVIRFALRINPTTAQVEVDSTGSDPIPHIIDGIVVHVRDIRVYVDRSDFVLNPTNCDRMSIANTVTGAGANFADPADQASVSANAPFQAADCSSLKFDPGFTVVTSAKTSRKEGASLTATVAMPQGALGTQANIARVKVELPKQLPSRLSTLQRACPARVFEANPAACPAGSIVGSARASTPILPEPLTGPAYFVSHGGEAFPSLIMVLQGYHGITVDLVGTTFISKAGVTSSTFETVPDVPVGTFQLTLPEGPDSALAANHNLCTVNLAMPTEFIGQNGIVIKRSTPIEVDGCSGKAAILSHSVKKGTLALSVYAPSAGKLRISGKGLKTVSKTATGRETLNLSLKSTKRGTFTTQVTMNFTPRKGTKQSKHLKLQIH
jgi:hypothetical protein